MTENKDLPPLKCFNVNNDGASSEFHDKTTNFESSENFDDSTNHAVSKTFEVSENFNAHENLRKEDDLHEEEPERPEEVVSHEGERAFFSGNTIHFVLPPAPENSFSDNDRSKKSDISFARESIRTDSVPTDESMKLVFGKADPSESANNFREDENSSIIPFSLDQKKTSKNLFENKEKKDTDKTFANALSENDPENNPDNNTQTDYQNNHFNDSQNNCLNDYSNNILKFTSNNFSDNLGPANFEITVPSESAANSKPQSAEKSKEIVTDQTAAPASNSAEEQSSTASFPKISGEIQDANTEETSESSSGFFSDFFQQSGGSGDELTKNFENALHNIFQTEENIEGSEENSESSEDSDQNDSDEDAEPGESDLSESERWQREEEEAQRENLDAVIRQNDEDSLFELGEKYQKNVSDLLSIEEPKNTEVRPESILEAMLFVGDRQNVPLNLNKAVSLMRNVSVDEAIEAIDNLNRRYKRLGAPYLIVQKEKGYSMELRPEFYSVRDHFFGKVREFKLSQKTIDLLALIAYRQPISLHELSDYNNGCASILTTLLKRDLITVEKKNIEKKAVSFYRTTDRFLKVFNLDSLDDLPIVEEISYR